MKSLAVSERYGLPRYVAHQAYYSLIGRDYEWELMPLALEERLARWFGARLGWGRLRARFAAGNRCRRPAACAASSTDIGPPVADEYVYRVVDALDEIARETGKTVPQIALNWLLQRPSVANVIVGARNEEQLRQNLGAVGWNLTAAANRPARRRQCHNAGVSLLASARLRRAEPAAGVDRTPTANRALSMELRTIDGNPIRQAKTLRL